MVPGDPGIPSTLAPTRYNNFAPRVGIAYSPNFSDGILGKITGGPGKTSIRAAYGIYYTSIEDLNLFYEVGDAPFGLYWVSPQPSCSISHFKPAPTAHRKGSVSPLLSRLRAVPPTKHSITRSIYLFRLPPGIDIHNRLPYAEDYNLTIQRELSKSTVLTLAFVGTQGHRLISQYAANPGNAALCMQLNQLGATPTCGRTANRPLTRCRTEARFSEPATDLAQRSVQGTALRLTLRTRTIIRFRPQSSARPPTLLSFWPILTRKA